MNGRRRTGSLVFQSQGKASGDRFILSMSDHIFDPEILKDLMQVAVRDDEMVLAADFRVRANPLIDIDDVTKVLVNDGKIRMIGKTIKEYNAFDTGLFLSFQGDLLGPGAEPEERRFLSFGGSEGPGRRRKSRDHGYRQPELDRCR